MLCRRSDCLSIISLDEEDNTVESKELIEKANSPEQLQNRPEGSRVEFETFVSNRN